MAEPVLVQIEVVQPLGYSMAALRADVRPLRACFEDLALTVRVQLQAQGIADPTLHALLDLRYADEPEVFTVPLPLEIENGAICLADPLPLDAQALRQALDTFSAAYAARFGHTQNDAPVQVVFLRVVGRGSNTTNASH